jgi:hypothetical protein
MVKEGLPHVRPRGGKILIRREDLDRFLLRTRSARSLDLDRLADEAVTGITGRRAHALPQR